MKLTKELILQQEKEAVLQHFNLADAYQLGEEVRKAAVGDPEQLVVTIQLGRRLVYVRAGSQTTFENDYWAARKRNVVLHHEHSSMFVRLDNNADEEEYYRRNGLSHHDYAIHGGAFPIFVEQVGMVGVIAISGFPMEDDHLTCYQGLMNFKKKFAC